MARRRTFATSASLASDTASGDRSLRRMAFYEAASNLAQHQDEEDSRRGVKSRGYFASRDATRKQPSVEDWRDHMFAISTFVREQRLSNAQAAPEAPRIKIHDPKNAYSIESLDDLDYDGFYIPIKESNAKSPGFLPWMQLRATEGQKSSAERFLEWEIKAFAKHMVLTNREKAARKAVRMLVEDIVLSLPDFKSTKVYTFGSFQTGISIPCSDIDIGLSKDGQAPEPSSMLELYHTLLKGSDFMCVVYRPENGIITAQHKSTSIDVQILAKGRAGFQDDRVARYLKTIPHIRALYVVVRTALGMRGLVDPYIGGISAYGTFMMLVAALTAPSTAQTTHNSPSDQLRRILGFWSDFDTTKYGINFFRDGNSGLFEKAAAEIPPTKDGVLPSEPPASAKTAESRGDGTRTAALDRIGRFHPGQPYLLCLQDPAWSTNDLGKRCHAIKHIQQTFKKLHEELERSLAQYDEALKVAEPSEHNPTSLLMPLVGSSHEVHNKRFSSAPDPKISGIIKGGYERKAEKYAQRFQDSSLRTQQNVVKYRPRNWT